MSERIVSPEYVRRNFLEKQNTKLPRSKWKSRRFTPATRTSARYRENLEELKPWPMEPGDCPECKGKGIGWRDRGKGTGSIKLIRCEHCRGTGRSQAT